MLSPVAVGVIIYASMLVILCVGFSLTHMIEKFPNFAHASYATIGTMLTYTFTRLWGYSPYLSWPLAFLLGGGVGIALYLLVVNPMQKAGIGAETLTFAMFALSILLGAILAVYSFWVMITRGFRTSGFLLKRYDFVLGGYPCILFAAPLVCMLLVVSLHLFITKVKFGIAIRATAEDPELAVSLGINIFRVHIVSWFLTGAMSGLAGSVIPLWLPTSLGGTDELLMVIIAGSVLGGLNNIYGAIIGGITMAFAQKVLPGMLIRALGVWIGTYEPMAPILVIIATLMIEPNGIAGFLSRTHAPLRKLRMSINSIYRS